MNKKMIKVLAITLAGGTLALSATLAQAAAADASTGPVVVTKPDQLQEVVVTGSLIPQTEKETAQPLTVITPDDIQKRGFSSVADALQHSSFATGSIQNSQTPNSFTPGAQVLSLFGLAPGYTKYLLDGRPIADYPALYNGTDTITSISGIPNVLIDHIDILPGGQSSIYGSDAIAGVININLKKKMDGPEVDVRYGWTADGGGNQTRIGAADGFSFGKLDVVIGGQYEKIDPIWGYQRSATSQYFAGNSNAPQTAERDWLVYGQSESTGAPTYNFQDPANCANVANQFGGSVGLQSRPNRAPDGSGGVGYYCGTYRSGFYTIDNGQENTQGYLHFTYELNPNVQFFGDVLLAHEVVRFNPGTSFFSSGDDPTSPYYYFESPSVPGTYLNLQDVFSPEEAGNLSQQDNKNTTNSTRATAGVTGAVFSSAWKYTADFTYTENKLTEDTHLAFTDKINSFFSTIMGPQLPGVGPGGQPLYNPNWALFYQPITPAQYSSFTGYVTSYSKTEDSLGRAQLTDSQLFALPGGDAGIAFLAEAGRQSWQYDPAADFLDGEAYLYSAVAGDGSRTRYAGTSELRLPVLQQVTIDMSGRYDDYKYDGGSFDKFTYNIGLEYRPLKQLLVRGRYGTAFKAPTISDQFQGSSGFFTSSSTDYYYCYTHGFTNANIQNCPRAGESLAGTTSGNPALQPITAKVWDAGLVWSPFERSSFSIDYMNWHITNEVQTLTDNSLLLTEAQCRLGQQDPTSPSCVKAFADVTRDPTSGQITSIYLPKENLAIENLAVLIFSANYGWDVGKFGDMLLQASYTHTLTHNQTLFPGDPEINLLEQPFYSTEFSDKANASLTWNYQKFSATVYGEYYGNTPNYESTLDNSYANAGDGRLGSWVLANASVSYQILKGLTVTANVDNVFNKQPPFDNSYAGIDNQPYNTENYNIYGRSYFIGANYKFGK